MQSSLFANTGDHYLLTKLKRFHVHSMRNFCYYDFILGLNH